MVVKLRGYTHASAIFSPCNKFRYRLTRIWDPLLPRMVFVMLNPSTADGGQDDPTIRKCVGFARANGCGSIDVVNLFAFRATDPRDLKAGGWQQGPDNDQWLDSILRQAFTPRWKVVCAWGAHARGRFLEVAKFRARAVSHAVPLLALRKSPDGTPNHPLMLPYSCQLEPLE